MIRSTVDVTNPKKKKSRGGVHVASADLVGFRVLVRKAFYSSWLSNSLLEAWSHPLHLTSFAKPRKAQTLETTPKQKIKSHGHIM